MGKREKIENVLQDENTDAKTKEELRKAVKIRAFASKKLYLPDNKSYLSYVALDRDYVSWAVFAAPEFSLEPKTWCFWIVGCIPYRGYFSLEKAENFSKQISAQGYEVYIAPIPAYSTLGWFDDPLLSTMLNQGEIVTANYIFHELAHQEVYIPDDSEFNEAFASTVAELGVVYWLKSQDMQEALEKYLQRLEIKQEIYSIARSFRQQLTAIYNSDVDSAAMRSKKMTAFANYEFQIKKLVKQIGGTEKYANWLLKDLNNAKLSAMSTYQELVPVFKKLFKNCETDFNKFYQIVASMEVLSKDQRREFLDTSNCALANVDEFESDQD